MSLLDQLEVLRKSWVTVLGADSMPTDDVLCRWLAVASSDDIERAFMKSANWRRAQRTVPTPQQIRNRVKDTIYWMKSQRSAA